MKDGVGVGSANDSLAPPQHVNRPSSQVNQAAAMAADVDAAPTEESPRPRKSWLAAVQRSSKAVGEG